MDEQNKGGIARTQSVFGDIARIVYLGGDNCRITEKNGFIGIDAAVEIADDGAEEEKSAPIGGCGEKKDASSDADGADKDGEEKEHREKAPARRTEKLPDGRTRIIAERVFLARAFPFDMKSEYISVLDRDKKEIGMIRSLEDFSGDQRALLERELEVKYYTPVIKRIMSVKERYGFSYWKTECEFGEKNFTLRDTFRSIIKTPNADGGDRICIIDVDGNRYEIPDVRHLDAQSLRRIEMYL